MYSDVPNCGMLPLSKMVHTYVPRAGSLPLLPPCILLYTTIIPMKAGAQSGKMW